jgi:hypothetical protein
MQQRRPIMTQSRAWNIVQALSAFKSQRRRHARYEHALKQMKRFPPHLVADVDASPTVDSAWRSFKFSYGIHKIYSFE